jgi:hypothetical protein
VSPFSVILAQLYLLLFTAHSAIIGLAVVGELAVWRGAFLERANIFLAGFFALACGIACNITLLFILGLVAALTPAAVIATGAISLAGAFLRLPRNAKFFRSFGSCAKSGEQTSLDALLIAGLYVVVAFNAVKAPGYFDDTMYHLPLARYYLEHHAILLDEYVRFPLFPQNIDLLFILGLMPGNALLAEGLAALPVFVACLGLIGAALWLAQSRIVGLAASLMLIVMPVVSQTLGYAYVDDGLALFCWAALLGVIFWGSADDAPQGAFALVGMLAGLAAGSKVFGGAAAGLTLCLLFAIRRDLRSILSFVLAALLFGSWWYIRSFILSGDPISPAGGPWFGYFLWNAGDWAGQKLEQAGHGTPKNLFFFPTAFYKAGAAALLPGFFTPFVVRTNRRMLFRLWSFFIAYSLIWFFVAKIDRYLAPVFAVGAFLSSYCLYELAYRLYEKYRARIPIMLPIQPQFSFRCYAILLGGFAIVAVIKAVYVAANWNKILRSRPGYELFQDANSLAPRYGARMMQVGFEGQIFFFNGVAIGDWFGPGRYSEAMTCSASCKLLPAESMALRMRRFDTRMLLVRTQIFSLDVEGYRKFFDVASTRTDGILLTLRAKSALAPK